MMDGAAFSGLGQMIFPGYIDGHQGVWMLPLEITYQYGEDFWRDGYQLHAHANGEKSVGALIDIVEKHTVLRLNISCVQKKISLFAWVS